MRGDCVKRKIVIRLMLYVAWRSASTGGNLACASVGFGGYESDGEEIVASFYLTNLSRFPITPPLVNAQIEMETPSGILWCGRDGLSEGRIFSCGGFAGPQAFGRWRIPPLL